MVSPRSRRAMARWGVERGLSHRRASWLCSTPRSGLFYRSRRLRSDEHLSKALRVVARRFPDWGYRLAVGYLRLRGWSLNHKRGYRLWRLNGLSLPPYRPSRKVKTGASLKRKALKRNDVWAWDFVHDSYRDGQPLRCLTVKDEATSFCLAIETGRHLQHGHVKALLKQLITRYGRPRAIRNDNGSELVARGLVELLEAEQIESLRIEPGKPWQNGSCESFNATFRKGCLNAELFGSLTEARVVIEQWRRDYNQQRPHSTQNYITPEMAYFGKRNNLRT